MPRKSSEFKYFLELHKRAQKDIPVYRELFYDVIIDSKNVEILKKVGRRRFSLNKSEPSSVVEDPIAE